MRIAFAHYSTEDDIGGASVWLLRLVEDLCSSGDQVAVHLHHSGRHPEKSSITPALVSRGAEVFLIQEPDTTAASVRQTLKFLSLWQPDVFLPQCLPVHILAAEIAGKQGLPWVLTVHSDDPQYWSILQVIPARRSHGHTVCVSHYLAAVITQRGFDPHPIVIPCGPHCQQRSPLGLTRPPGGPTDEHATAL